MRTINFAALLIFVSFLFGFWLERSIQVVPQAPRSQTIRLLVPPGAISEDLLEAFSSSEKIHVQLEEYPTGDGILSHLGSNPPPDVILTDSREVWGMIQDRRLLRLDIEKVRHSLDIAPDFSQPEYDPSGRHSLALAWGLDESPQGLWIKTLAVPKGASNLEAAYRFMDFMLSKEVAEVLATHQQWATTNQKAESLEIPAEKKPSYLRKLSLSELRKPAHSP